MPEDITPADEFYNKNKLDSHGAASVKSEWSMAIKDMDRIDRICSDLDILSYSVRLYNIGDLNRYHSLLFSLFMNLEPLLNDREKGPIDGDFKDVKYQIYKMTMYAARGRIVRPKMSLLDKLVNIHRQLLRIKQDKGLGMPVTKMLSEDERLVRGFLGE